MIDHKHVTVQRVSLGGQMKIFANLQPGQNFVPHAVYLLIIYDECTFKGIVSRDFEGLQMILMDRIGVPMFRWRFILF